MRRLLAATLTFLLCACEAGNTATISSDNGSADLATDVASALQAFPSAEVVSIGNHGVPTLVRGEFGKLKMKELSDETLQPLLAPLAPVFRISSKNLELRRVKLDELNRTHVRLAQKKNGLEVVGGELVLHLDADGQVYAVSGGAQDGVQLDATPAVSAELAANNAKSVLANAGVLVSGSGLPSLVYLLPTKGELTLAWRIEVSGADGKSTPVRDLVYVNANSGEVIERHAQIHSALTRKIYTSANTETLPGTLLRTEGQAPVSDSTANTNYDMLGKTYDCYKTHFNRDGINGAGLVMKSSVHYSRNYDNAYWDGTQMVYGDGNFEFASFALAYDVTVHELTHGVTDYESRLVYQSEPGALNEAISDIFGAACEAWANGAITANTWKMAEDIYTPGKAGDALRYMDSPTKDGFSTDYYPTRYQGTEDYGGVHINSGIANLAFKLMVTGGTHPRSKTTIVVPALGLDKAAAIFYRANTQYLTANANFQAARGATAQAAKDLYGDDAATAVHAAWTAVGVPGAPATTTPVTPPPPATTGTVLNNGSAVNNLSGQAATELRFTVNVPAGASNFKVVMSGGTGDADLYVRFGAAPTTATYDARPYLQGNNETAALANATAGTWHVLVRGYQAFSGVSLVASWTAGTVTPPPAPADGATVLTSGVATATLTGEAGSEKLYKIEVPAGAGSLKVTLAGGSGDADLYVKKGSAPTTSAFDGKSESNSTNETVTLSAPAAATYYVLVKGYSAYQGTALTATF